jgi:hypothetical protein
MTVRPAADRVLGRVINPAAAGMWVQEGKTLQFCAPPKLSVSTAHSAASRSNLKYEANVRQTLGTRPEFSSTAGEDRANLAEMRRRGCSPNPAQ